MRDKEERHFLKSGIDFVQQFYSLSSASFLFSADSPSDLLQIEIEFHEKSGQQVCSFNTAVQAFVKSLSA